MNDTISCPNCAAVLRRTTAMEPGVSIQCPRCDHVFVAPDYEGQAPVTFTDRPDEKMVPRRAISVDEQERPRRRENFSHHWKADLGEWFAIANRSWSRLLGPAAGYLFFASLMVAAVVLPIIFVPLFVGIEWQRQGGGGPVGVELFVGFQILQNLLLLPLSRLLLLLLFVGVLGVAIRELRGRDWSFGSFFLGFRHFGALSVFWLIQEILGLIVGGPLLVLLFVLPLVGQAMEQGIFLYMGLAYLWYGVTGIIYLYLYLRWIFALPLILDQNMTGINALKFSWFMTKNHVWILFAFSIVQGMILFVGYIACCVGLLFASSYVALMYAGMYLEALYPRLERSEQDD